MFITVQGKEIELNPTPIQVYTDYKAYETVNGFRVHVDNAGEVIVYQNYVNDPFIYMHDANDHVKDLGDRFEIQRYVGGPHYFFRYHISKKTRKAITYFDEPANLDENQVYLPAYRIWKSIDLGDHVFVKGLYDKKSRIVKKVDNSVVGISEPIGTVTSELFDLEIIKNNLVDIRTKNGRFHFDMSTMEPITYTNPRNDETLAYFTKSRFKQSRIEIFKGWKKYLVDPSKGLISAESFKFFPS